MSFQQNLDNFVNFRKQYETAIQLVGNLKRLHTQAFNTLMEDFITSTYWKFRSHDEIHDEYSSYESYESYVFIAEPLSALYVPEPSGRHASDDCWYNFVNNISNNYSFEIDGDSCQITISKDVTTCILSTKKSAIAFCEKAGIQFNF